MDSLNLHGGSKLSEYTYLSDAMPLHYTSRNLGSETAFSVTGGRLECGRCCMVAAVGLYHDVDSY